MKKKAYIINLTFKTWQNQIWFCATDENADEESTDADFEKAEKSLDAVGDICKNSNEFFNKAVEHFENCGFSRIQK